MPLSKSSEVPEGKLEGDSQTLETDFSDFEIVLPLREIQSVSIFDPTIYDLFTNLRATTEQVRSK